MPSDTGVLDRSALGMIVRTARRQLRLVDAAATRLADDRGEGLHDFRVAVRRLRSTLRVYAPILGNTIRSKDRRRLKRLARCTADARDAEVQLAKLRGLRDDLGLDEQAAVALLVRRLRRRLRDGYATARADVETHLPRTTRALTRRLRRADTAASLPFRSVIAPLLVTHATDLRPLLEQVPSLGEIASLHQVRIEVKRVRYVLEPVRHALPGSSILLRRLERLQDLLGELHDFEGLEEVIRGAPMLTRLVRERQRRLHAELIRDWLGPHASVVLAPLDALAERLGQTRRPALPVSRTRGRSTLVVSQSGRC